MNRTAADWILEEPLNRSLADERARIDWRTLTVVEDKTQYLTETYFRESLADAREVLGANFFKLMHRYTFVVFKPDAIVGRRIHEALAFLADRSFSPVYAFQYQYNRHTLREDWRYQLNQLTLDRMRLNTILAQQSPSLIVVLRDDSQARSVPASVRLQALKGPSYPDRQTPNHLRYHLRCWSRLLKFIHTPDEPADVIRELGIFLDHVERREFYTMLIRSFSQFNEADIFSEISALYNQFPEHDLDLDTSLGRVKSTFGHAEYSAALHGSIIPKFVATLGELRNGAHLNWCKFEREMIEHDVAINWDLIVIGAAFVHNSFDEERALVVGDGVSGWYSGLGVFFP